MNILVINGSPKKNRSNTMILTKAFIEGAGWNGTEIINVYDMNIEYCLGCFSCWNRTPGICVLNDDMKKILDKVIEADIIIWSFPLYYFNVPAGLKNLIDRQLPLNLPFMDRESVSGFHLQRYDLSDQKHIIISTCGLWTASDNYDAVISMFDHFLGKNTYEKIICAQGELFQYPQMKNRTEPYLEIIRKAGKEYTEGKIEDSTKALIKKPLFERKIFEDMADASWGLNLNNGSITPSDESLVLTKQMAALYKPDGKNRVLEMNYTDIGKTYQILLTENGSEVITDSFQNYTTKIDTPYKLWKSISNNEISGPDAFFQGKFKVLGDVNLMLDWDKLFGLESTDSMEENPYYKEKNKNKSKSPNMIVLLLPWIVFWSIFPMNSMYGGVAGIVSAAAIPILWLSVESVVYENIGISSIIALSLSALLTSTKVFPLNTNLYLPLSYLIFGAIWIIGSIAEIPLTANYSAAKLGGKEKAFSNPIFIKTNRILTVSWACMFIFSSVISFFLQNTKFSSFMGLIIGFLLGIMGAFTTWFQKWYPGVLAKDI